MTKRVLHDACDVISALRQAADIIEAEYMVIDAFHEYCQEFEGVGSPGSNVFENVIRDAIRIRCAMTLEQFMEARSSRTKIVQCYGVKPDRKANRG